MAADENFTLVRKYLLQLVKTDEDFKQQLLNELEPNIKQMITRYAHLDPEIQTMIQSAAAVAASPAI